MTEVAEAVQGAAARLAATSGTARLDAELLMAHALGVSRSDMLLRHCGDAAPDAFAALVDRRAAREPVAYILGEQDFYGRTFRVTPAVLIPRADSETTVAAALEAAPAARRVLDCGTGSGALLLTLLAECPAAAGVGIDISAAALGVAEANAARLGLAGRAAWFEADWHSNGWTQGLGAFDCVIANPPYVEEAAALAPDIRDHEPARALFSGPEGMDDYRILVPQLPPLLAAGGIAVLEIGSTQAGAVSDIARSAGFSADLRRDLAGRPRALILRAK